MKTIHLAALLALSPLPHLLSAAVLIVDARSNIYGAGHAAPSNIPAPSGGGGGLPPASFSFSAPTPSVLRFSAVTGTIDVAFGGPASPDGHGPATGETGFVVSGWNGLSAFAAQRYACLVGVFLSEAGPLDPAPATLDFASLTLDFRTLSPGLAQIFYVGDGRTTAGVVQDFLVPTGATRLFLGIPDHSGGTTPAGWYRDNKGSVTATFEVTPLSRPAPPLDVMWVAQTDETPARLEVSVKTERGSTYRLEAEAALSPAGWTLLKTVAGTGGKLVLADEIGDLPVRYYRVVVE